MWGFSNSWPYGQGFSRRYIAKAYPYILQPFDNTILPYSDPTYSMLTDYPLPISLVTTKSYLKIDPANTADDTLITLLISVAQQFGEAYTGRDFTIKKYLTFRDNFNDGFFSLRKSPFVNTISFQYYVNNILVIIPAVYYNTQDNDYNALLLTDGDAWPTDGDIRAQGIKLLFNAGYGTTEATVPQRLRLGMLQHILQMYENRGDATAIISEKYAEGALPLQSKLIYDEFRIRNINASPYY